jgi:site-specific DNA-cytosine methylase
MDGSTPTLAERLFTAVFLFAGLGAGARGFLDAFVSLRNLAARVRSLGGVDVDPIACRNFQRLTGSVCHERDIGKMTAADLRALFGDVAPDVVFMSAPCQGFSGLISDEKSQAKKYQELNRLAVHGVALVTEAWGREGPGLILFENVPRIASKRGEHLLKDIRRLLRAAGYVLHEGTHNCGEIGNLAQSRERFLLVARHSRKVPVFLYQPPRQPLRPCGDVIEQLPLPGDASSGRLHRMPEISLRTWLRLAAIRPGKDWRDLSTLDGEARPAWARYAVTPFSDPTGAVAGSGTNSTWGVADVRVAGSTWRADALGVVTTAEPFGTITGRHCPTNGAFSLADVRVDGSWHRGVFGVVDGCDPFGTITGTLGPSHGAFTYADVRVSPRGHGMHWRVLGLQQHAPTVTGTTDIQAGAPSVADLRVSHAFPNSYGVLDPSAPARTITGESGVPNGANGIADVRLNLGAGAHTNLCAVLPMDEPARAVTGAVRPAGGAPSIADVRLATDNPNRHTAKYYVTDPSGPARAITGTDGRVGSGAPCLADLRLLACAYPRAYGVLALSAPFATVTGNVAPGGLACSVADLRITCDPWRNSGVLGVLSWERPSYCVTGSLDLWAGFAAVADPRVVEAAEAQADEQLAEEGLVARSLRRAPRARRRGDASAAPPLGPCWSSDPRVPSNPRLVVRWHQGDLDAAPPYLPVIAGRGDGSWHRPITLLERAALQGLPSCVDGRALELEGTLSQVAKQIGNAVPVGAALAIAREMLRTLVLASTGAFMLSADAGVWVKRRRNGTFPLYLDEQLQCVAKRRRREARRAVARIERNTRFEGFACEGSA